MPTDDKNLTAEAQIEARTSLVLAELLQMNARLTALFNASKLNCIVATNPDGLITLFNSGAERMLGYAAGEMVGKQTPAVFHVTLVWRSLTGWLDNRTSTRCVTSKPEIGAQEMPPCTGFPTGCHGCPSVVRMREGTGHADDRIRPRDGCSIRLTSIPE